MRGVAAALAAACLTAMLLPASSAGAADEPFWNSRPLGYWLNQLRVGDSAARQLAARGVGEIATEHGSASVAAAVPLLVPCLDASDAPLRAAAADALAPIGAVAGSAGPRLLMLFERDPDAIVRRAAGAASARIEPGSARLISTAARVLLHDEEPRVREVAAATLVEAGKSSMAAMPAARQGMHDRDPMVRVYAAAVVARLGSSESAVPVLLDLLHASDGAVRAEAAGFLADAAPADARSVPALLALLNDDDRTVRLAAIDALGTVGRPARVAIEPLWHLIRDPDEEIREHAVKAIRLIKEESTR
jgi:HEAT repeat protein